MLTTQEYENLYCIYCDSQRCLNRVGESIADTCPYWKLRQEKRHIEPRGTRRSIKIHRGITQMKGNSRITEILQKERSVCSRLLKWWKR